MSFDVDGFIKFISCFNPDFEKIKNAITISFLKKINPTSELEQIKISVIDEVDVLDYYDLENQKLNIDNLDKIIENIESFQKENSSPSLFVRRNINSSVKVKYKTKNKSLLLSKKNPLEVEV